MTGIADRNIIAGSDYNLSKNHFSIIIYDLEYVATQGPGKNETPILQSNIAQYRITLVYEQSETREILLSSPRAASTF